MARPGLEVADIFRDYGSAWRRAHAGHVSLGQLKVMSAIERCRTAALGGHVARCADCTYTTIAYNSCLMGRSSNGELACRNRQFSTNCSAFCLHNRVVLCVRRLGHKVSLWLGYVTPTTAEIYTRGDPTEKLDAMESIVPSHLRRGAFQPSDRLIALLKRPS